MLLHQNKNTIAFGKTREKTRTHIRLLTCLKLGVDMGGSSLLVIEALPEPLHRLCVG
jgi:hypothetical protein